MAKYLVRGEYTEKWSLEIETESEETAKEIVENEWQYGIWLHDNSIDSVDEIE